MCKFSDGDLRAGNNSHNILSFPSLSLQNAGKTPYSLTKKIIADCAFFFCRCIYLLNLGYLSGNCGELPFITSSLLFNCKSKTLGHYFSLLARGERKNSPLCALCNR